MASIVTSGFFSRPAPAPAAIGTLLDNSYALITGAFRSIGTIIPNVVVEENHHDELLITDHPVEFGAIISDHAFKKPVSVQMRCGWSNSSAQTEGYVQQVYQALIALQDERQPFDVYTGKRVYHNMLLQSLAVTTDQESEWALMVVADLREIIITNTQATAAPNAAQAAPQRTGSPSYLGTQATNPYPGAPTFAQTTTIQYGSAPLNAGSSPYIYGG